MKRENLKGEKMECEGGLRTVKAKKADKRVEKSVGIDGQSN